MKKSLTLLALSAACALTAPAQVTVQGAGFFDNWSIGLLGGGLVPTTHSDFIKDTRATYGLELTKQLTPVIGVSVQGMAANNVSPSRTIIDATNVTLLGKANLSNLFCGYQGVPRLFEVEAVAGVGWGHHYFNEALNDDYFAHVDGDKNYLTSKFGLNFNFNVGQRKAWTLAIRPAIVYNMDNTGHNPDLGYNVNNSAIELTAGVTYHFKNHNNGAHYMTKVRAYDQAEVDGLNAKVNDLRAQVNDKNAELAKQSAQIRDLQEQLNDCRNQKPRVETVTLTHNTNSLEQTVTFRQGKSVIDASQLPNVERVATFLKNHPSATVSIKGYASPEGSAEINARIALARAEAVKTVLVNKYRISASRITAEGQGVGNMFSEPDWNRVSICTIDAQD